MRSSKKLKICKVESRAFAKYCLMRGADYLGVHVVSFELSEEIRELCDYINEKGGRVVLLTKERDTAKLAKLATFYRPWALQLHYEIDAALKMGIEYSIKIPIIPVFTDTTESSILVDLLKASEFAIYDTSFVGGTGIAHAREHLSSLPETLLKKVFIAGGVTPVLIEELAESAIGGFDVQSFCRQDGRHHYGKTKQLMDVAKGIEHRQLSISLTDVSDLTAIPDYIDIDSLEYQIDFSEGNLYKNFVVDSERVMRIASSIDAPLTLHIFETDVAAFQRVIDDFMRQASLNIVRVNIQYSPKLKTEELNTYDAKVCASLYYKDVDEYVRQYPIVHDCISLILPSDLPRKVEALKEYRDSIIKFSKSEVWFDRKVDLETVKLVLASDPNANFIAGEYILEDWTREADIYNELRHAK